MKRVRLSHKSTGLVLAEGPLGLGVTHSEGTFYIRREYLRTSHLRPNLLPGLCPYEFLYV
jgi:hypothetical protein